MFFQYLFFQYFYLYCISTSPELSGGAYATSAVAICYLFLFQFFSYPCWIPPTIQNSINKHCIVFDAIVNSKRFLIANDDIYQNLWNEFLHKFLMSRYQKRVYPRNMHQGFLIVFHRTSNPQSNPGLQN